MKLGDKGTIVLITLLSMVAPLSTDMYMPALPGMAEYFRTTEAVTNLTLTLFFLFFALGMLFFGPVSDKLGRRKVLIAGIAVYGAASVMCGIAMSIQWLIVMRMVEAAGAGCMVAISTAIIKDRFEDKRQASVLAITQAMMTLAPMLAPIVGAFVLKVASWRSTFYVLAGIAVVMLVMTFMMEESLPKEKRNDGPMADTFKRLLELSKDLDFTKLLIIAVLFQMPMMAFISTSSYIFVGRFGLTPTIYSLFFSVHMAISILGPILSVRLRHRDVRKAMLFLSVATLAGGALITFFGHFSPILFVASYIPANIAGSAARPYTTGVLINKRQNDAGSASSLINFGNSLAGTLGMFIITLIWSDYISGVAMLLILVGALGAVLSKAAIR